MTRQVRIEHPDGTVDTLSHIKSREQRDFGKKDQASLYVPRAEADGVSIEEQSDEAVLEVDGSDLFAGPIMDIVRGGSAIELIVASPEQYAVDAKPTGAGNIYDNVADSNVVADAVAATGELSQGTVNTVEASISLVFSHSSQARKMRKAEEVGSGELLFNADKTVDFIDTLGSDRTATTLSPSNGNVTSDFEVSQRANDEKATHVRVIGAGEGPHQITAEAVVASYAAGDRQIWRTFADKDMTSESTAQSRADALAADLDSQFFEVSTTVKGVDIALGDTFHVEHPAEGISENLRVVSHKRTISSDGAEHKIKLSSYQDALHDAESKRRKDLDKYNVAAEGNAVPINAGGSRNGVTNKETYELKFYYPGEVVYEHRMNVRVIGLGYRTDERFTSAFSGPQRQVRESASHQSNETLTGPNTWQTIDAPVIGNDVVNMTVVGWIRNDGSSPRQPSLRLYHPQSGVAAPSISGIEPDVPVGESRGFYMHFPVVHDGDDIALQAKAGGVSGEGPYNFRLYWSGTSHSLIAEPGIRDWGSEASSVHGALYPKNCNVFVNGTSMSTSFGDGLGEFERSVDIRGALNPGQVNKVVVDSDSRGDLQVYAEGDVYRQILGQG